MGLDEEKETCLNNHMNWKMVIASLTSWVGYRHGDRGGRPSPQETENNEFRKNVRGQLLKLKEKGLSIRILTL